MLDEHAQCHVEIKALRNELERAKAENVRLQTLLDDTAKNLTPDALKMEEPQGGGSIRA